ncbi:MAG: ATP-binding protein, partial [Firmicutes bacterium]|nr:ATP-binding protein [Candidatus Onthovivens merdipullorum]
MNKKDLIDLIRAHLDNNETMFWNTCKHIADGFYQRADERFADYLISLFTNNYLIAQDEDTNKIEDIDKIISNNEVLSSFLMKINYSNFDPLYFNDEIKEDFFGIYNAIKNKRKVNKFLFIGESGTGKTASSLYLAKLLNKKVYSVVFENLIDSKLGESLKNLSNLFKELNSLPDNLKDNLIIFFDEIDTLVLNRISNQDLREMGRLTSLFLKELDNLSSNLILIATTNLSKELDKALLRRFDAIINFDRYSKDDLIDIAILLLKEESKNIDYIEINENLFKKIINIDLNSKNLLTPGKLKNIIRSAIAFSSQNNSKDY